MESDKVIKIKICAVTTNRADYGRLKPLMREIQKNPRLELQVVVGTPLLFDHLLWNLRHGEPVSLLKSLPWYLKARFKTLFGSGSAIARLEYFTKLLSQEGFPIHARIPMLLEGGNPRVMTKILGFALLGISSVFEKLKPDMVLINGDRFEMLPIAFATVCANILLVHIEGGDVSGTLDESTRHAITKLAHIHFSATEKSAERIRRMGEDPRYVFAVGSPIIDTISQLNLSLDNSVYDRNGFGGGERIDFKKPFLLVLQHPVTTRYEENRNDMEELIAAVDSIDIQKFFLAPNIDAGSDGVSAALREYRERKPHGAVFFKSFIPQDFYRILANTAVAVGNSSSFIRESAFLGTPAVIVGDRQQNRERGRNVIEVRPKNNEIVAAVNFQLQHGKYQQDTIFGDGNTASKIVETLRRLKSENINLQKTFFESSP